jgi:hypothetical protein
MEVGGEGAKAAFGCTKRMVSRDLLIGDQGVYAAKLLILLSVEQRCVTADTQRTRITVLRLKTDSVITLQRGFWGTLRLFRE